MAELHQLLNAWPSEQARAALGRCNGSRRWVEGMLAQRPFASRDAVYVAAQAVWDALGPEDYLEAFAQHPAIGADPAELARKFGSTAGWSEREQASVRNADAETIAALHAGNLAYRARFGFTFIVCATGKSAAEMLAALHARQGNAPEVEVAVAAAQQAEITRLRLAKLEP